MFRHGSNEISFAEKHVVGTTTLSGSIEYKCSEPYQQDHVPGTERKARFEFLPEIRASLMDLINACKGSLHPSTLLDYIMRHYLIREYGGNKISVGYAISQPPDDTIFVISGDISILLKKNLIEDDPFFTSFNSDGIVILERFSKIFDTKKSAMAAEPMHALLKKANEHYSMIGFLYNPHLQETEQAAFFAGKLEFIADALLLKAESSNDSALLASTSKLKGLSHRLSKEMLFYGKNYPAAIMGDSYEGMLSKMGRHIAELNKTFKYPA